MFLINFKAKISCIIQTLMYFYSSSLTSVEYPNCSYQYPQNALIINPWIGIPIIHAIAANIHDTYLPSSMHASVLSDGASEHVSEPISSLTSAQAKATLITCKSITHCQTKLIFLSKSTLGKQIKGKITVIEIELSTIEKMVYQNQGSLT